MLGILKKIGFYLKEKKVNYLIDSEDDTNFLICSLKNEKILGIDTEFDWRTTYIPKLSLLQISTRKHIFLIDCLRNLDLSFLKDIFEDEKKIIIFHSSRSDSTVLSTNLNIQIKKSFDIQIAEQFLKGGNLKNYGSIVRNYFSINLDKSETNSNWLKRPLSDRQINYASDDVRFLIEIFNIQKKNLVKKRIYDQVIDASKKETILGNQPLKSVRLKKHEKKFSKRKKQIFLWREEIAESENIPPSYVFKDKYLKTLSDLNSNDKNIKLKLMKIIGDSRLTRLFISELL